MILEPIHCPDCKDTIAVIKHGKAGDGKQRYLCQNPNCRRRTVVRVYAYRSYLPEVKEQISDMAVNGSGIRDTARVLKISLTTVIEELKNNGTSKR